AGQRTSECREALAADEQMSDAERRRPLYVAATRAREHLVGSAHRGADYTVATAEQRLAADGAAPRRGGTAAGHPRRPAAARHEDAGLHKGPRHLVLPRWSKGRYGSAVGRAVHGVLQSVDLRATEPDAAQVQAQCVAEGVTEHHELVTDLVRSALGSDLLAAA